MRLFKSIALLTVVFAFTGCGSYKQVPYLQNSESYLSGVQGQKHELYDARIMPKDLITITVSTSDPAVAMPFNLTVPSVISSTYYTTSQPTLQKYLVDNEGEIDFPIVGKLRVGGLTKSEAEELIIGKLDLYLKETPIVSVRMTNYNISVLGEVSNPGTFTIDNEKVNIFEALAMAGDMTIYGRRLDVKLIRENGRGERTVVTLDMTDPAIISSPYYFLQQSDVLYVTPNKTKAKTSDISSSTTIWFTAVSTIVSFATLIVSIVI